MLARLQSLFLKLVHLVEEHPAPLRRYFHLYFAILAVRLSLEFFSSHKLFDWPDVLHIGLWFIFIVLAFLLQLQLFSGEGMVKVTKLVIVGFTIALTAPIIDLMVSGGVGAKMNYLAINDLSQLPFAYLTMGGASLLRGATLGIRIEIVLLVVASFNYVRTKRKSLVWGLAAAWSIYTVLFISGLVPLLLNGLMLQLGLVYWPADQSTILLLLVLDLALLGACLYRYAPRVGLLVLRAIPWGMVLLASCLFILGAGLARHLYPLNWVLDPTTLFWFPLMAGVGLCLATLIGMQTLQRQGQLPAASAERGRNFFLVAGLGMSLAMDFHVAFVFAGLWGLLFLLHEPPLNLRRAPGLRQLLGSMALCMVALLGFVTFGGPMVGFPIPWLLLLLICQLLGGLFTDLLPQSQTALPWYPNWTARSQRLYGLLCMILFVGAGTTMAFFYLPSGFGILFGGYLAICSMVGMLQNLRRIHWLPWMALPLYLALAIAALQ